MVGGVEDFRNRGLDAFPLVSELPIVSECHFRLTHLIEAGTIQKTINASQRLEGFQKKGFPKAYIYIFLENWLGGNGVVKWTSCLQLQNCYHFLLMEGQLACRRLASGTSDPCGAPPALFLRFCAGKLRSKISVFLAACPRRRD
jgi:hypothetical protein